MLPEHMGTMCLGHGGAVLMLCALLASEWRARVMCAANGSSLPAKRIVGPNMGLDILADWHSCALVVSVLQPGSDCGTGYASPDARQKGTGRILVVVQALKARHGSVVCLPWQMGTRGTPAAENLLHGSMVEMGDPSGQASFNSPPSPSAARLVHGCKLPTSRGRSHSGSLLALLGFKPEP